METINDIVREVAAEMLNTSMQEITAERIHGWATRLGEVVVAKMETTTPTCQESRQVGNAAAMREAVDAINRIDTRGLNRLLYVLVEADIFDGGQINKTISSVDKAKAAVNAALAAPPRNCDLLANAQEAMVAIHNDRGYVQNPSDERWLTVNWLFAEAKGENK